MKGKDDFRSAQRKGVYDGFGDFPAERSDTGADDGRRKSALFA